MCSYYTSAILTTLKRHDPHLWIFWVIVTYYFILTTAGGLKSSAPEGPGGAFIKDQKLIIV